MSHGVSVLSAGLHLILTILFLQGSLPIRTMKAYHQLGDRPDFSEVGLDNCIM
jgi:hypothetical protein